MCPVIVLKAFILIPITFHFQTLLPFPDSENRKEKTKWPGKNIVFIAIFIATSEKFLLKEKILRCAWYCILVAWHVRSFPISPNVNNRDLWSETGWNNSQILFYIYCKYFFNQSRTFCHDYIVKESLKLYLFLLSNFSFNAKLS